MDGVFSSLCSVFLLRFLSFKKFCYREYDIYFTSLLLFFHIDDCKTFLLRIGKRFARAAGGAAYIADCGA